jgi:FKBP-type peptidyl-prolyl cis-trans isomerase FklB
MKKIVQLSSLLCILTFASCDSNDTPKPSVKQFEELKFVDLEDKVSFSAGYNQCMQFYDLSSADQTKMYFNLAYISNGYIAGIEQNNISDSVHYMNILNQSFSGMTPDTTIHKLTDISYAYGYIEALKQLKFFKEIQFEVNSEFVKNGYTIAAVGQKPSLSQDEMNNILTSYVTDASARSYQSFLDENKKRPEITTTPSGLQYEIIENGEGPNAILSQSVTFHWIGKHITEEQFLNSKENNNNEAITINLPYAGVTAINEGLLLMNKGAKYKFYAPSILAYGNKGFMDPNDKYYIIKPNEPLIYEIELIDVK